ncbi:transcriptional regulator [Stenomitos frigidus ULC18]|uniref:Transcriptional regulator n=2 Tax=Stenomitos TaxID=1844270 RepID=A0A2T1E6B6_9CYAN|nr:transcriptional regulator [Stenomitos frigidus ULC18]
MLEYIVGCKWSIRILTLIRQGVERPGAITRSIDGLTTKVQGDCLNKMVSFGILERIAYAEIPPRVEYKLTHFGQRFVSILDAVSELQHEIDTVKQDHKPVLETNDEQPSSSQKATRTE